MTPRIALLSLVLLLLVACAKPVPPEHRNYVGIWTGTQEAEEMELRIDGGGMMSYRREKPGMKKSLETPIKSFEGDDFIAGVGPMVTRFKVSQAPRQDGSGWTMVVDGMPLHRQRP